MGGFAGAAVEEQSTDELVAGVAKAGGGLRAAVAEGFGRGIGTKLIGDAGAVVGGVEDDTQTPVDGVAEGVIEQADALARGHGGDGWGLENRDGVERAAVARAFRRSGRAGGWGRGGGGGAGAGGGELGVVIEQRLGRGNGGVVEIADARAVDVVLGGSHGEPGVVHSEGRKMFSRIQRS